MSDEVTDVENNNSEYISGTCEGLDSHQPSETRSFPSGLTGEAFERFVSTGKPITQYSWPQTPPTVTMESGTGQAPPAEVDLPEPNTFVTLLELETRCRQQPVHYLVDGFLPADDVHVAVGDSGLGKTPWAYQLGLCVATGAPFLGHDCRKAKVLYYDMENGPDQILELSRGLCTHLGISSSPPDFLVFPGDANPPALEAAIAFHRPQLVIVDTLRALYPDAEGANDRMNTLMKALRKIARENKCAILLLHHIKKPQFVRSGSKAHLPPALENARVLDWLHQASGARALINLANTRIALDAPRKGSLGVAVVMKYFIKMRGERGPELLGRVLDAVSGEPIAYERMAGIKLLNNPSQEATFEKLPKQFSFAAAKRAYGKTDNPTREYLLKCCAAGLIRQTGKGIYEKLDVPKPEPLEDKDAEVSEVAS